MAAARWERARGCLGVWVENGIQGCPRGAVWIRKSAQMCTGDAKQVRSKRGHGGVARSVV